MAAVGDIELVRRQWLEENCFLFGMFELQWEAARCALEMYKELYGDMHVPSDFVVSSSEPWPEEM